MGKWVIRDTDDEDDDSPAPTQMASWDESAALIESGTSGTMSPPTETETKSKSSSLTFGSWPPFSRERGWVGSLPLRRSSRRPTSVNTMTDGRRKSTRLAPTYEGFYAESTSFPPLSPLCKVPLDWRKATKRSRSDDTELSREDDEMSAPAASSDASEGGYKTSAAASSSEEAMSEAETIIVVNQVALPAKSQPAQSVQGRRHPTASNASSSKHPLKRPRSHDQDEENGVEIPCVQPFRPKPNPNRMDTSHLFTKPRPVDVTVCFMRDSKDQLFTPTTHLTSAEHTMMLMSTCEFDHSESVEPAIRNKWLCGPRADSFFTTSFDEGDEIREVKCHIRRLLNVYFLHEHPETLDFGFRVYDEISERECGQESQYNSTTLRKLGARKLLFLVTEIRKMERKPPCTRADWAEDIDAAIWRFSAIHVRRALGAAFWRRAVAMRESRVVEDVYHTDVLPVFPKHAQET